MQASHIYFTKNSAQEFAEARRHGEHKHVAEVNRFYKRSTRDQSFTTNAYAVAQKCGLLCYGCHLEYDAHYRDNKKEKAPFDEDYRKHGVAAARWEQWKSDDLKLSASFD